MGKIPPPPPPPPLPINSESGTSIFCPDCWSTGKIGIIFKKTCPRCNGDPKGYWEQKWKKELDMASERRMKIIEEMMSDNKPLPKMASDITSRALDI